MAIWIRGIVGAALCLVGIVWLLQGTDLLHGSGMSGEGQWAVIGAVVAAIGFGLLGSAWQRARGRDGSTL